MARFRPGPLTAAISGSVGSITFVTGSSAGVIRSRPRPRRHCTAAQLSQLSVMTVIKSAWQLASPETIAAWNAAAASITFPDSLGINRHLSGYGLFLFANARRPFAPLIDTIPTGLSTTPILSLSLTSSVATSNMTLGWTVHSAGSRWYSIFAARTFRANIHAPIRSFKQIFSAPQNVISLNVWSYFLETLGTPTAGEALHFKIVRSDYYTLPSPPVLGVFIMGA